MSLPPNVYSSTSASKRLPSHTSHGVATPAMIAEVGVDDAGAVAVGAGALGVGAEQRRLHAVRLRERLADRVEQAGVRRRVAAPRALDRALVDRHHAVAARRPSRGSASSCPSPATPVSDHQHAERDVDVDVLQVVRCRRRAPPALRWRRAPSSFSDARSSRWRPVNVPLARSPSTVPSNTTSPPPVPAPRAEVDDVVGDRDRLRLVLDDEHGVALVAQLQQQVVHALRCRAGAARSSARRTRR